VRAGRPERARAAGATVIAEPRDLPGVAGLH
jgi:hypothetical protein